MINTDRQTLHLVIELVRAADVARAGGVTSGAWNRYLLRDPDGSGRYEEGELLWDESMQADLSACADFALASEAVERLAETMRTFVDSAGWKRIAARIDATRATGRPLAITVRSAAHELYTLPWELLDLAGTPVCETDCLLRYESPGPASAGEPVPPRAGGRVLMAWSAAGGGVPAAEHIDAIAAAARAGHVPFDHARDVVASASVEALEAALGAAGPPVTILHLLCHGEAVPDGSAYGLRLDGAATPVSPERIRALIAPYRNTLRMVVVSACLGSNPGAADNALGSVAQTIHEAGVPTVIASRYPLSVAGSMLLTERLYQRLFVDLWSLEQSFLDVRAALRDRERGPGEPRDLDWASVQLYGRSDLGLDFRPWVIRPYRGLESYGREHQRFFFGRDQERRELCGRVAKALASGAPRFLLVAGASGTGKSSLALAGLATDLEAGRMVTDNAGGAGGPSWSTVTMRPGEGGVPTESLARRLDEHRARLRDSGARPMVVLVVDQLEELFTSIEDQAQHAAFLRTLWRLANEPDGDVFVVATIRIEYLGRFGNVCIDDAGVPFDHEMLAAERHYLVRQMGPGQQERVICGPAEAVGVRLEPGLLGRLQTALRAEPGALPLLSYTLDQLWKKRSFATLEFPCPGERVTVTGWWLTDRAYDELGGVEGALATTADALFARLGPPHQDELRRVLVQLVHDHDDPMLATRRRGWRLALQPDPMTEPAAARVFDETINALVAARLLVQGADEDEGTETWIELAHDSLIRFWPRLQAWYQDAREWLSQTDELHDMATAWQPNARKDDTAQAREAEEPYLLRGNRLSYQLEMWQRHGHHLGARDRKVAQAFLDACARAEDERRAELLARGRAARQRTRIMALSAIIVAVVMSVLGVLALRQQHIAKKEAAMAKEARERAVASESKAQWQTKRAEDAKITAMGKEEEAREAQRRAAGEAEKAKMATEKALRERSRAEAATEKAIREQRRAERQKRRAEAASNTARDTLLMIGARKFLDDGEARWAAKLLYDVKNPHEANEWKQRADDVSKASVPWLTRKFQDAELQGISPDGKYIFTYKDGMAWKLSVDGKDDPVARPEIGEALARGDSQAISPDWQHVVTVSDIGTARLWRTDGEPIVLQGHEGCKGCTAFGPDGQYIVSISKDAARVWRMDGKGTAIIQRRNIFVIAAALSPDGQRMVTGSSDGTAQVWQHVGNDPIDSNEWNPIELRGRESCIDKVGREPEDCASKLGRVHEVAFSSDGQRVLTISNDMAQVWRTDGQDRLIATYENVKRARFSPDGNQVLTVSKDGTRRHGNIKLWPIESDESIRPIRLGRGGLHTTIVFSADGKYVLTGSSDGTARVWRTDRQREPIVLKGHGDEIWAAAFSPDASYVVTASSDTVRLWRLDQQRHPDPLTASSPGLPETTMDPSCSFADQDICSVQKSRLVEINADCLPAKLRRDYLGEPPDEAAKEHAACEEHESRRRAALVARSGASSIRGHDASHTKRRGATRPQSPARGRPRQTGLIGASVPKRLP
jgi:WD40 repeat protein